MLIPVRCWSCGFPVAEYYEEYLLRVKAGEKPEKILDDLDIKRYCCRRMFVSQGDFIEDLLPFRRY
ncbi:MAG: DNA-directed RNA polymerase subunit N [Candidatus Norongarragalinales archaeon]